MKKNKINNTNILLIKMLLLDLFVLAVSLIGLSLVFSVVFYKLDMELKYADYLTYIIVVCTSFNVSYFTTKQVKNNGILVGIVSEIPFIIFSISEFAINHEDTSGFLIKMLIVIIIGAISGIFAVNKKSKIKVK